MSLGGKHPACTVSCVLLFSHDGSPRRRPGTGMPPPSLPCGLPSRTLGPGGFGPSLTLRGAPALWVGRVPSDLACPRVAGAVGQTLPQDPGVPAPARTALTLAGLPAARVLVTPTEGQGHRQAPCERAAPGSCPRGPAPLGAVGSRESVGCEDDRFPPRWGALAVGPEWPVLPARLPAPEAVRPGGGVYAVPTGAPSYAAPSVPLGFCHVK